MEFSGVTKEDSIKRDFAIPSQGNLCGSVAPFIATAGHKTWLFVYASHGQQPSFLPIKRLKFIDKYILAARKYLPPGYLSGA
jgi:hypothetical protein